MSFFQHRYLILFFVLLLSVSVTRAQDDKGSVISLQRVNGAISNIRNPNQQKTPDTLQKRDRYADSITIRYRYADKIGSYSLDSSVNDFYKRFPLKSTDVYLGNIGTASRSIVFSPGMQPGWDHGFHAFDRYMKRVEDARYFTTTRPYTELGYIIAGRAEQTISLLHTQNPRPNWNIAAEYQLISSPGTFQNQKTQNSGYLINSYYQGKKKRYALYFAMAGNSIKSAESGGIQSDTFLTSSTTRFLFDIPSNIGGADRYQASFFQSQFITTGNIYKNFHVMLRQQYDLGQKDSIVIGDTNTVYLFYPRLRLQHQVDYRTYAFRFYDANTDYVNRNTGLKDDSIFYANNYGLYLPDTVDLNWKDSWKEIQNDFSVYQFPYAKNPNQYLKAGATLQNLKGEFLANRSSVTLHNFSVHGEYRNRTRNQKWDIDAGGRFYINGFNSGDYTFYLDLLRVISKKKGFLELGFRNTNRRPSFLMEGTGSFDTLGIQQNFNKENLSRFNIAFSLPEAKLKLEGNYYAISNFLYFSGYAQKSQYSSLFNLFTASIEKQFKLSRKWNWYTQVVVQQVIGNGPVNVPLIWTRNRLAFEGVYYKNLNLSTGIEFRYHTPYKADGYSPVFGQFFYQGNETVSNLPDISAFLHFRIKSFNGFVRAENLNTARFGANGLDWFNVNKAAGMYYNQGFTFRFGILWWFVN